MKDAAPLVHTVPTTEPLTLKNGVFGQMINDLGIQNIRSPHPRNAAEWEEARAAEQISYLTSWVYITSGLSRYRLPYQDLFEVVMPYKGRSGMQTFLDSMPVMIGSVQKPGSPLPRLADIAAIGLLTVAAEDSKEYKGLVARLDDYPFAREYIERPEYRNVAVVSDQEQELIRTGFFRALGHQIREDDYAFTDMIYEERMMYAAQGKPLPKEITDKRSQHNSFEQAFREGTRAAQRIVPSLPKHFFGDFLLEIEI